MYSNSPKAIVLNISQYYRDLSLRTTKLIDAKLAHLCFSGLLCFFCGVCLAQQSILEIKIYRYVLYEFASNKLHPVPTFNASAGSSVSLMWRVGKQGCGSRGSVCVCSETFRQEIRVVVLLLIVTFTFLLNVITIFPSP